MRQPIVLLIVISGLTAQVPAQTCTGLCQQQVICPAGQTTSISGTVYAPNNTDPLPNVVVYIPNAPVDAFTAGVSCPVPGQLPSGSPLVGTTTAVDGTFKLVNVPVGSNIPLVVQSGRWRRQVVVPGTTACTDTAFSTRMPQNQTEGDIPKIAIVTGSADEVECVLRKVGVSDSEFTDPTGSGRINIYSGSGSPGARIDASTPSETVLTSDLSSLNQYDALMLPCQGAAYGKSSTQLANLIQYANAGGRVYASHYSYVWMYQNPPFNGVANWQVDQATLPDGVATVDPTFPDGQTLTQWLQLVGASTVKGQIAISAVKHDLNGIVAPTQSWLTYNDAALNNPVMQFTFNTPIGAANQCGRILFNEYHVENPVTSPANQTFPAECPAGATTPQEKLLEYSLFNLTNEGGAPTLTPTTQNFGNEPVGFTSASQSFTVTNNSVFALAISSVSVTGDYVVTSNACSPSVAAGATCTINVAFQPTALGTGTGTLTIASSATPLTSALTGVGTAPLAVSASSLNFGNIDVGTSSTKGITLTNTATGAVPVPPLATTGDFVLANTCGATLSSLASCTLNITFTATATGPQSGTLTVTSGNPANAGLPDTLTGNGVDFSLALNHSSGNVIAGYNTSIQATVSPISGYAAPVTLTCTTTAPASTCIPSLVTFTPTAAVAATVNITTNSKYTVVGYGGLGGNGFLMLFAIANGCLLFIKRRSAKSPMRLMLWTLLLATASLSTTGCSGSYPTLNPAYTPPGTYAYTLTATDGTLTHSATFQLNVASN